MWCTAFSTPTSPHTPQQSASKKPQPFLKSSFYVTFYALSVGAVDLKRRYARFSVRYESGSESSSGHSLYLRPVLEYAVQLIALGEET